MTIPKRPLAVSKAKKTLPLEIDWGKGIPKDRLRYINAKEEALIKLHRNTKAERSHMGVKAYVTDDTHYGPDAGSKGGANAGGANSPGNAGVGQGGQGGASSGGGSTASSTAGSSSTSSSSTSSTASKPASSAAPQASTTSTSHASTTNGSTSRTTVSPSAPQASVSISKTPNYAAQVASDRLKAATQSSSKPSSSIQGMINSQASGQYAPNGSYYGPKGGTSLNEAARTAASRSAQTAGNGSYYGPKGTTSLNSDARLAAARSVGFNPDPVQRTPGDAEAMGRMMMAESGQIRNQYGKIATPGLLGVGEVIRNRMMSDRYGDTVPEVISQRSQFSPWGDGSYARTPANATATRIAESILSGESPPTVGTSLNYGNLDTINNKPGYSSARSKAAFNAMTPEAHIADARNPKTFSHTFGTIDGPSDVAFNSGGVGSVGLAAATSTGKPSQAAKPSYRDVAGPPTPAPTGIPAPDSIGMMPGQQRDPAAARMAGLQQSFASPQAAPSQPQAAPSPDDMTGSPPGYFSQFAMTPEDMDGLKKQAMKDFSFGELMQMQKNQSALPGFMAPITNDVQRMANQPPQPQAPQQMAAQAPMAPTPGPNRVLGPPGSLPGFSPPPAGPNHSMGAPAPVGPSTYSPEAGPGDQITDENPIQGPSNPMQEGPAVEDPGVVKERQKTYAQRGATIGSIVAGPLGAVIGGTLGYQMGKTNPAQRQAIASNPMALSANAQSINQMVEERGGKGNPDMQVRPEALRDVLTNPQAVASNPQKYTTLEQMLAALAMGKDPETGKPV